MGQGEEAKVEVIEDPAAKEEELGAQVFATGQIVSEEQRISALVDTATTTYQRYLLVVRPLLSYFSPKRGGFRTMQRDPKPPPTYICHRCNQPGHYKDQCPTKGDPIYDRGVKLVHTLIVLPPFCSRCLLQTTGIPRAFLKKVETGAERGALQLPSGGFAVMMPNEYVFL